MQKLATYFKYIFRLGFIDRVEAALRRSPVATAKQVEVFQK
jgi:hypothetical protein